jgi:hypothetical protein
VADTLRLATWDAGLSRRGPGLLVDHLDRGRDPQIAAAVEVIRQLDADVLLITGIDLDTRLVGLNLFAERLAEAGLTYPHRFALPSNSGLPTGLDLDRNGRTGEARDAMGYGRFQGQGGIGLLSRLPVEAQASADYTATLWSDLPGALLPPDMTAEERAVQRLSSTSHWQVSITLPGGGRLGLLAFAATPPVFDGSEDRNGRRNHDEAAFWLHLLDGAEPPTPPFVLMGKVNLDPVDGDGRPEAIRALLSHPALQDPAPRGAHGRIEPAQKGDPALDTALYPEGPGGLRVDYVLPSAGLRVSAAGVMWPADGPLAETLAQASRHYPVWVDISLP